LKLLYYVFTFIVAILLFSGCKPTITYFAADPQYKGKYLLYSQSVKGHKHISTTELEALLKQKAQYKFLGLTPYLTIHYLGKSFYDTAYIKANIRHTQEHFDKRLSKKSYSDKRYQAIKKTEKKKLTRLTTTLTKGNWMMSSFGEFPSILDTSVIHYSSKQLSTYLSSKGYFRNSVTYKIDTLGRMAFVSYKIHEGPVYSYNKIAYDIPDTVIYNLVIKSKGSKLINLENYDETRINEERELIYKLLKNNGYYDFTRQYVNFLVDTTGSNHTIKMTVQVIQPEEGNHIRYTLNKVQFIPRVNPNDSAALRSKDTINYDGVQYCSTGKKYNYKILDGKIRLKSGSYFKQDSMQRTQQQLGSLDMYRFVNINMVKKDSSKLNMLIYTSPLKKYQITQEYGMNMVQGVIPGPFFNVNFKNRNIFGNYEMFDINARYGVEGQASVLDNKTRLQTIETGINASLTLPQLLVPTRLRFTASKFNPKSRIIVGYNSVQRPEYDRYGFRSQFQYLWQKGENSFFTFSPIDINVINSHINLAAFTDYLDNLKAEGNKLYVSFLPSIVTNMNFSYTYSNTSLGKQTPSFFFRPSIELGGLIPNLVSKYLTHEAPGRLFGLQYYEYYRIQIDFRYYKPIDKKTTFAMRANVGYSRPFGATGLRGGGSFVLPYEKYFFTGGANSNRAWPYRRLGPGSYQDPNYTYEEPGNMILETSFELRSKIYRFIEGAYFIDAGNIWTIKDATRPGSDFKYFKSIPEIAVGTGVGARLNFTFIIVRFDLAVKAWDPGNPIENRFVLFEKKTLYNKPILNFSIGYPF